LRNDSDRTQRIGVVECQRQNEVLLDFAPVLGQDVTVHVAGNDHRLWIDLASGGVIPTPHSAAASIGLAAILFRLFGTVTVFPNTSVYDHAPATGDASRERPGPAAGNAPCAPTRLSVIAASEPPAPVDIPRRFSDTWSVVYFSCMTSIRRTNQTWIQIIRHTCDLDRIRIWGRGLPAGCRSVRSIAILSLMLWLASSPSSTSTLRQSRHSALDCFGFWQEGSFP